MCSRGFARHQRVLSYNPRAFTVQRVVKLEVYLGDEITEIHNLKNVKKATDFLERRPWIIKNENGDVVDLKKKVGDLKKTKKGSKLHAFPAVEVSYKGKQNLYEVSPTTTVGALKDDVKKRLEKNGVEIGESVLVAIIPRKRIFSKDVKAVDGYLVSSYHYRFKLEKIEITT